MTPHSPSCSPRARPGRGVRGCGALQGRTPICHTRAKQTGVVKGLRARFRAQLRCLNLTFISCALRTLRSRFTSAPALAPADARSLRPHCSAPSPAAARVPASTRERSEPGRRRELLGVHTEGGGAGSSRCGVSTACARNPGGGPCGRLAGRARAGCRRHCGEGLGSSPAPARSPPPCVPRLFREEGGVPWAQGRGRPAPVTCPAPARRREFQSARARGLLPGRNHPAGGAGWAPSPDARARPCPPRGRAVVASAGLQMAPPAPSPACSGSARTRGARCSGSRLLGAGSRRARPTRPGAGTRLPRSEAAEAGTLLAR